MDATRVLWLLLTSVAIGHECFMLKNCSSSAKCICFKINGYLHADCSHIGLSVAPEFHPNIESVDFKWNNFLEFPSNLTGGIRFLNLAHNFIEQLSKESLYKLRNLENLTISNNELKAIEKGTFKIVSELHHLDLSYNLELSLSTLTNVSFDLQFTKIKVLNLEKVQCTYGISTAVYIEQVLHLFNTSLEQLNIASNRINHFEFGVFSYLPKTLRIFNIADNNLSFGAYLLNFGQLSNVVMVNASYQSSFHAIDPADFNFRCKERHENDNLESSIGLHHYLRSNGSRSKLHTKNAYLEFEYHVFQHNALNFASGRSFNGEKVGRKPNTTLYLPPNLQTVYFHDNMYKYAFWTLFLNVSDTLTHVHFQNSIIYRFEGPVYGVRSVQYLDLSNNFCRRVSDDFFIDFLDIRVLNLSNNLLGESLKQDEGGRILRHQKTLQILDLANNKIVVLPQNIFRGLSDATHLNLSSNSLAIFRVNLSHLSKLKWIDLSSNQLISLNKEIRTTLHIFSEARKLALNLRNNPLQCSCSNIKFLTWIGKSRKIEFLNMNNYTCLFQNSSQKTFNKFRRLLKEMEKECASFTLVIAITSALLLVVVTVIMSKIVHRYRWRIRYLYYVARRDKGNPENKKKNISYHFDAFVSYAEEDREFVITLVKFLEENFNLRLCIHQRDFIPGTSIIDNITNAIHNSRRTVCFLTSHFLRSYWCEVEMNMARIESVYSRERSNVLLFIIPQKSVFKELPLKWIDLIENKSYMEICIEDQRELSAFRVKLAETLKEEEF
ncbi:toll-like receptor 4 [Saccostrea echinata]|uniref:toll-like receptor 4 n=1 Tax=Saccostrea echinata TaxID=191078 RepID=UPI002A832F3F|nr:toll-like receptor 4 [Saccostrea echinata]